MPKPIAPQDSEADIEPNRPEALSDSPFATRKVARPNAIPKKQAQRAALRTTTLFVGFVLAMLGMILGSAFLGASAGRTEQRIKSTATISAYISDRLSKCASQIRTGNAALAAANCEEVLKFQPTNEPVLQLLSTARFMLTPSPAPPTATPRPVAQDKNELLKLMRAAAAAQDLDSVIVYSEQMRGAYPTFETEQVSELRYNALVARGVRRVRGDDMEAGIFDLDQAEQLQPLSAQAKSERDTAELYQSALGYYGADWDIAIKLLTRLGGYRDSARKLYEAYIKSGDELMMAKTYCQAEIQFGVAISLSTSPALEGKRNEARTQCQLNPTSGISGTVGVSGTQVLAGVAGRIIYNAFEPSLGYSALHSLSGNAASVVGSGGGTQPIYQPSAGVAALNTGNSVYGFFANGSVGTLANFGGSWVSVSPDGSRIAYVLYENNEPMIYVARTDASTPPISMTKGTWAAWGPTGRIAFQGCTDVCGIHTINPDSPSDVIRITTSAADVNMQWSPNGGDIIYASNYSGQWAIYRVSLSGGFAQITESSSSASAPTFSPDGSRVAYQSNRDGSWGIYVANADGSNAQKVLDLGTSHSTWASDRMAWLP